MAGARTWAVAGMDTPDTVGGGVATEVVGASVDGGSVVVATAVVGGSVVVVAAVERSLISLRLRSGRHRKAMSGGFAYGSPGFGYRSEAKAFALIAHDVEQATITRIVELRTAGASLRAMAVTLTAEGHQPKRGGRWHPESLRRILARLEGPDE